MRKKDWLVLKSPNSHYNPILVRKDQIECILPSIEDQLQSRLYLVHDKEPITVDQSTSLIEGLL